EAGQAHYLVLDLVGHADAPEVAPAQARQHRDRQDLRPPDGLAAAHARHLGVRALHHLEAARGVEIEEADAEPRRLDAGARHGVRDVVELEVEEHVHPVAVDHAHDLGARMEEELLAHLEDADVLGEQRDQALGNGEGLDVEGEDQPVADAVGPGWEEGPAAGHQAPALRRGPTSAAARAAASATGTSVACLSLRRFNSTAPRASARGPTVSRTGRPIRSASLNLTPGRSSRSSRSVSTPAASSSAASRSAVSPSRKTCPTSMPRCSAKVPPSQRGQRSPPRACRRSAKARSGTSRSRSRLTTCSSARLAPLTAPRMPRSEASARMRTPSPTGPAKPTGAPVALVTAPSS